MSSATPHPGAQLATRLRELREREWPGAGLTQLQLAAALSAQSKVGPAAVSTWENVTNPKTPPPARLTAYARFFATKRSLEGEPHLLAVDEFDDKERERYERLEHELLQLHASLDDMPVEDRRLPLQFDDTGPIVIVCPEAPKETRGSLADASHANHVRLHRFADADALIELYGHIRALNPERNVLRRLPRDTQKSDLQSHLVIIGGIGWNLTLRRVYLQLRNRLPIEQFEHPDWSEGEVFRIRDSSPEEAFFPNIEEYDGERQLTEDIGLIAQLPNPFNTNRTLTICNGVHSSGVLGAVLALTDETVRPTNETYLGGRFPRGDFAMLVMVPVVDGDPLAPDLMDPTVRLFEWSPPQAKE